PLSEIPYASMAIITLAYRAEDFPDTRRSGYLVPAVDGRAVKAVTFSTVKWPQLTRHAPAHVVRCSIGRVGEVALLQREDKDLASLAAAELADAAGITAAPIARRVTRWGGALPQYNVGHLDRVARGGAPVGARRGLAGAGRAKEGMASPACIATAQAAARQVTGYLAGVATSPFGMKT